MQLPILNKLLSLVLLFAVVLGFSSCNNEEEAYIEPNPEVKELNIGGYMLNPDDSVQFKINGVPFITPQGKQYFGGNVGLSTRQTAGAKIEILMKGGTAPLVTKKLEGAGFVQTIKFFHDGNQLVDNMELTPPANPQNIGMRFMFNSKLYKSPVDIVISESYDQAEPGVYTLRNLKSEDGFSQFVELPKPQSGSRYIAHIYKAGTKEPYFLDDFGNITIAEMPGDYNFGDSYLLVLDEQLFDFGANFLFVGFIDISNYFQ